MSQNQTPSSNMTAEETKFSSDNDNMDLKLMQQDSQELIDYILRLQKESKQKNARSARLKCWCRLTWSQKQVHDFNHEGWIKTPTQFSDFKSFTSLSSNNGRIKEANGIKFFEPFQEKPPNFTQNKKEKLNKTEKISKGEEERKQQSIKIELESTNFQSQDFQTKEKSEIETQKGKLNEVIFFNSSFELFRANQKSLQSLVILKLSSTRRIVLKLKFQKKKR